MTTKRQGRRIAVKEFENGYRLKIGGRMHEVTKVNPSMGSSQRLHLTLCPVDGDPRYDEFSLFITPHAKFKIYNPK